MDSSPAMVLLVDDQAMVGEAVRRLLADESDLDLHYCADSCAAVGHAARMNPAVILQDLVMPQIDGLDLVRMFRAHPTTAQTPIIVLSTREDPYVKSQAFAAGANDYLVKLPDKVELVARLRFHAKAHTYARQRDEAMQALRESQQQLLESHTAVIAANQKLEDATRAKSAFLASMSHEIRTPMNGVVAIADLLLHTPLTDHQRDYVGRIQQSADALLAVVNDILDLSKVEAGHLHLESIEFDPRVVIASVVALLGPHAAKRHLDLVTRIASDVPSSLHGDPARLRQVLTNLVGNAVKFTEQGAVTVNVTLTHHIASSHTLRFEVTDTGIGVSPDTAAVLFQPFLQAEASTSRRFGGTGLGLAISKQLVEKMGGAIGVTSELGRGSTFWFSVPFDSHHETASADQTAAHLALKTGLRVLVADDNAINQFATRRMLELLGATVEVVATGTMAVEAVEASEYDAVLMDGQMPEMDGFAAATVIRDAEARRGGRRVPIIALTASAMRGDRDRCLAAGMDDYLTKPVKLAELRNTLAHWTG